MSKKYYGDEPSSPASTKALKVPVQDATLGNDKTPSIVPSAVQKSPPVGGKGGRPRSGHAKLPSRQPHRIGLSKRK